MSCNTDNDFLPSVFVTGSIINGYKQSIGADVSVGKYAKFFARGTSAE